MKLLVLAAGEGKRLRPYTDELPKCMVELAGRPLLSYQLSSIKKCHISLADVALIGGHKISALQPFGLKIFENDKYSSSNMVATLFCARNFMTNGEDLVITYGDIVYEKEVLRAVLDSPDEICLAADKDWERLWRLRMSNPLDDVETFVMSDDRLIRELGKKPGSASEIQAQYVGLIKIRGDMVPKFIDAYDDMNRLKYYDGQNFDNMYMTSFIQHLIDIGWQVRAEIIENGWLEVDTIDDLQCYEELILGGSLDSYCRL